jgi:hypothetical protein
MASLFIPKDAVSDILTGNPLVTPEELRRPEIPGQKLSLWSQLSVIWLVIRRIPQFISNRPSVVDGRIIMVGHSLPSIYSRNTQLASLQFMHGLQKDKKYASVGAVG